MGRLKRVSALGLVVRVPDFARRRRLEVGVLALVRHQVGLVVDLTVVVVVVVDVEEIFGHISP